MKNNITKYLKKENLIVLILAGVLLFVIAMPTKNEKQESATPASTPIPAKKVIPEEEYVHYLEGKLSKVLSEMEGVGKVHVMLTLKSTEELVVEKDVQIKRSQTEESDSEGGERILSTQEQGETTLQRTASGINEPYVVKTLLPKVEGVLVVAQGGDGKAINKKITEVVEALFGVEAHKVKVVNAGEAR